LCNNIWALKDLPLGCKLIRCKWVFKKKENTYRTVHTFKARLVAKGFTQKGRIDYFDTYASIATISSISTLIASASICGLYIHKMDVKIEFLNGDLDDEI